MLSFWKKVLEKASSSKNKEPEPPTDILGPRYDGPLHGFVPKLTGNIELGKCNLQPALKNVLDNRLLYQYFRQYLETKLLSSLLKMYEVLEDMSKQKHIAEMNCGNKNTSSRNNGNQVFSNFINELKEQIFKVPDDIQYRLQSVVKLTEASSITQQELDQIKDSIFPILEEYWNEFCRSEFFYKYQIELLTSRSVTLGDIMQHDVAFLYFMEFLEHEGCQHVAEFWLAAVNFEQFVLNCKQNAKYDQNQALDDAVNIYEKYLSLQATCPLGFSDEIRYAVEEAICEETNGPRHGCFHPAIETVLCYFRNHILPSFFSSQHYVHLLSDTIRQSAVIKFDNHSPSSSVSEFSVDTKKCLLPKSDPESIWRYRKQSGLSFGRIDQFGRFQRNVEPEPERKNESKIRKAVNKWIQKTENKVQEEMAWQVAEMVVKDITDLTMGMAEESSEDEETSGCSRI